MRLSEKKALELSIKKWEFIVEQGSNDEYGDGYGDYIKYARKHGFAGFKSGCGLCEKYTIVETDKDDSCGVCPLHLMGQCCYSIGSIYKEYSLATTDKKRLEEATKMLLTLKELQ